ncbi:ERAD-associated protein [Hypoxylon texense]
MSTLGSAKREATDAEMPWPDPVKKRAKMNATEEEGNREQVGMIFDGYSETDNHPEEKDSTIAELRAQFPEFPAALTSKIGLRSSPDRIWAKGYLVTYATDPRLTDGGGDATLEVVGTYDNMRDANAHVMRLFYEQHRNLVEAGLVESDGYPDYGCEDDDEIWCENFWSVDGDQMLSLWACYLEEDGRRRVRVRATKHDV